MPRHAEYWADPEKCKAENRKLYANNREKYRQYKRTFIQKNPEKASQYYKRFCERHPDYDKNRKQLVSFYMKARSIALKSCCESCGATQNLERHHPDYTRSEIFITLCRKCHLRVHRA